MTAGAASFASVLQQVGTSGNILFGGPAVGAVNTTTIAAELLDKLWVFRMRRNGNAVAATMRHSLGTAPNFHGLVDPAPAAASQYCLVWECMVQANVAAGACRVIGGLCHQITDGVAATLCGVGFYADAADNLWHCFVNDCPTGVAPITARRNTATAHVMTTMHRLRILFDGPTRSITWFIDGVQADTWVPAAPLDRMGALANLIGPETWVGAFVPALGDVSVRCYAGALPVLRYFVRAAA